MYLRMFLPICFCNATNAEKLNCKAQDNKNLNCNVRLQEMSLFDKMCSRISICSNYMK